MVRAPWAKCSTCASDSILLKYVLGPEGYGLLWLGNLPAVLYLPAVVYLPDHRLLLLAVAEATQTLWLGNLEGQPTPKNIWELFSPFGHVEIACELGSLLANSKNAQGHGLADLFTLCSPSWRTLSSIALATSGPCP